MHLLYYILSLPFLSSSTLVYCLYFRRSLPPPFPQRKKIYVDKGDERHWERKKGTGGGRGGYGGVGLAKCEEGIASERANNDFPSKLIKLFGPVLGKQFPEPPFLGLPSLWCFF